MDTGKLLADLPVSSRAPVWGASLNLEFFCQPLKVSSRAPVWGASLEKRYMVGGIKFQVVPPCGGHPVILNRQLIIRI